MDRNSTKSLQASVNGFYTPDEEQVALLQSILQGQLGVTVSLREAQEIGIQLLSLYECLARDRAPLTGVTSK